MEQGQGIGEEDWRNKIHDRMQSLKLICAAQFKEWSEKLLEWVGVVSKFHRMGNAIKLEDAEKLDKLLGMLRDFKSIVNFLNQPKDQLKPSHGDALDLLEQSAPSFGAWLDEHVFKPSHGDTDTYLNMSTALAKLDLNNALDAFEQSITSLCTSLNKLNCEDG